MIIIFNGPPGSGKDEACAFISSNYGFKSASFKEQLFIETAKYFGVSIDWFMSDYDNRTIKETKVPELGNLSRREALIHVSEVVIKPKYGNAYFGTVAAEQINSVSDYCFSDGGFVDEIYPLINTIGVDNICIVQLYRDGCSYSNDSRSYVDGIFQEDFVLGSKTKIDNQKLDDLPIRMYQIHNNGTISDFHRTLRILLRKEVNGTKDNAFSRKSV
jgi:hypothetical protein